jgi:hypothetical protein
MPAKTKAFLTHCLGRIAFKRNLSDAAGLTRSNPVDCPAIYQFPHYLRRIVPKCHERVNCFQPVEMARVPLYWVAEANFLPDPVGTLQELSESVNSSKWVLAHRDALARCFQSA